MQVKQAAIKHVFAGCFILYILFIM